MTTPQNWRERFAMNIVYQIGDELEVSVEKRQATNDKLIDFVMKLLSQVEQEVREDERKKLEENVITGTDFQGMIKIQNKALEQVRSATLVEVREVISKCSDCKAEGNSEMLEVHLSALEKKE